MNKLLEAFDSKNIVALGKSLKEVENQTNIGYEVLKHCSSRKGGAHIVGITGPPGAGKSTLVGKLCKIWATQGLDIGVVCVDPTSPFSGGALLGDRVRMAELSKFPNIFIKSLATRGSLGGIAASTSDIIQLLDAFGKEIIIVETVGVGQVEFDVLDISDTIVLVNVPGLGDALQTLKAGIMEIADLYVINQADRQGADESVRDLQMMVHESVYSGWDRPIIKTVATGKEGLQELAAAIDTHKQYLIQSELWKKKREERNTKRFKRMLEAIITSKVDELIQSNGEIEHTIKGIRNGNADPISSAFEISKRVLK